MTSDDVRRSRLRFNELTIPNCSSLGHCGDILEKNLIDLSPTARSTQKALKMATEGKNKCAWVSFRDPDGQLELTGSENLYRHLKGKGLVTARALMQSPVIRTLQKEKKWIPSTMAPDSDHIIIHPRIFFPSYPHEWTPSMLHRAASLTLDANCRLLSEGWELKDATPTNVLFDGHGPIFVDFLSPTQRTVSLMGWRAYGQFCRTFLIPLYLNRYQGLPLHWMFLANRDGITPEIAKQMLGWTNRWRPMGFSLITLPCWMAHRSPIQGHQMPSASSDEVAKRVSKHILKGLAARLDRLKPSHTPNSQWSNYQDLGTSYSTSGMNAKTAFVEKALATYAPSTLLDLGCNTGKFAKMAARTKARVVAVDGDPHCVDRLFIEAEEEKLDIQTLVIDLGRPSPRSGWDCNEEASFIDRVENRFDMTLALALFHHLLIRERIPLDKIFDFFAKTTKRFLVVEWVPPSDPQFQKLAGPNQALYSNLDQDSFENALSDNFSIVCQSDIPESGRVIYLLTKRASQTGSEFAPH